MPRPRVVSRPLSEHAEQAAVIQWSHLQLGVFPELQLLYAIPNGGKRPRRTAQRMKEEGQRAGMPDLHLPVARGGYVGLWIEMKTATGSVQQDQKDIHELLRRYGHRVVICRSIESAVNEIRAYLKGAA